MRVFISHKVLDRQLVEYFRSQLLQLGLKVDQIFLSEETRPGADWNQEVLGAMQQSDMLVFIYTDPSYDWDWCLFECGYFAGLGPLDGRQRSLICINSGIGRPSPLNLWQDVSSEGAFQLFLEDIARRVKSPLAGQHVAFLDFVKQFWLAIYQRLPLKDQGRLEAFKQRRLVIIVPPEEMEKVKSGKVQDLSDALKVEISDGSRSIFPNAPLEAGWKQFLAALSNQPLQLGWMDSLPVMVRMLNGTRTESPMLPLVRDGLTQSVAYRPSIAQRDVYGDGSVRYTVVFIRTPDSTVCSSDPVDRTYVWLMLARNFREAVLDLYKRKLESIQMPEQLKLWVEDLQGQTTLVRIDAVSRGMNMNGETGDINLFCEAARNTMHRLRKNWEEGENELAELRIRLVGILGVHNPPLNSLPDMREKVREALERMITVNTEFTLHVAASYLGYITKPSTSLAGPS